MTQVEHKLDFELIIGNPYLSLASEVWGVYCEGLVKLSLLWLHHTLNGTRANVSIPEVNC